MATVAETLLALNEILQDYDTEVKNAGPRVTTLHVLTKERSEAREEIKQAFKKAGIKIDSTDFGGNLHTSKGTYNKIIEINYRTDIENLDQKAIYYYALRSGTDEHGYPTFVDFILLPGQTDDIKYYIDDAKREMEPHLKAGRDSANESLRRTIRKFI